MGRLLSAIVFSRQHHLVQPAYSSISELETAIDAPISAILLSHEFTDHSHEKTLRTASSTVPVFGHPLAKVRVDGWQIFDNPVIPFRVYKKGDLSPLPDTLYSLAKKAQAADQQLTALPRDVSVLYVPTDDWYDAAGDRLHALTIILFTAGVPTEKTYSLLYSPHGVPISALEKSIEALNALPYHRCLALLHGWDHIALPWPLGKVNLGKDSGKNIAERLMPKYWLRTRK